MALLWWGSGSYIWRNIWKSPAWALFYLQDFEFSIDFKAPAELLGSLIVDLVVADVQVNQRAVDFESFSQGLCSLIPNAVPREVEDFQCTIALQEEKKDLSCCMPTMCTTLPFLAWMRQNHLWSHTQPSPSEPNGSAMSPGSLHPCESPVLLTALVLLLALTPAVSRMSLARATEPCSDLRDVHSQSFFQPGCHKTGVFLPWDLCQVPLSPSSSGGSSSGPESPVPCCWLRERNGGVSSWRVVWTQMLTHS